MPRCAKCRVEEVHVYKLTKCAICLKLVCEQCAIRNYGRIFCSKRCSLSFFLYEE
jgi:hypothetical protein